ncbi:hypothetical protein [Synechococcus elongatus]|uniref:hypothetical protein n=1 Tax=Synechococcus elongatus TaxID=32046 RepID=UPI000F7D859C|nr:hypothetical protein [Synechococcus elongatus]
MDNDVSSQDFGLTAEQEILLYRIHEKAKRFSRAELIEAVIWAWQQVFANKNIYCSLALEFGVAMEETNRSLIILPRDAPVLATDEELRAIEAFEDPEGFRFDEDDDAGAGVLG